MVLKNGAFLTVCLLVAVTPMFRGSVHAWAQTIIQIMVALGAFLVVMEKLKTDEDKRNRTPGREIWMVVGPVAALGIWSTIMSPHPAHAVSGLIMLLTYLVFFWLVVVSVNTRKKQRVLVWVVVGTAAVMGVIGLLKRYDILVISWWDYAPELKKNHGGDRLSGVYVNANHMAGFLEMAIPMLTALFLTRLRSLEARIGMIFLVLFLILCQVLTLSRGGWAATAGALLFMAMVLLLMKGFDNKRLVGFVLAGVIVTALVVMASTPVVERVISLTQRDVEENITGRITYWTGTWHMIKDYLAAGTGPGTFSVAFFKYQVPGLAVIPGYAHNDYLQFAAETGILAFPVMLWLIVWFFRTGFSRLKSPSRQTMGIALGTMAAVVAILIHSFSEGNLQIPANIILFTALIAAGLRNVRQ